MNRLASWIIAGTLAFSSPAYAYDTGLIVPVFAGPRNLARNVSTTLYLQVWRTLRRKPWPNPRNLDFGRGITRYDWGKAFSPSTSEDIYAYTRESSVQMTLWGSAKPLGDGVVVQAFLGAPAGAFGNGRPEIWSVQTPLGQVSLDLPRRVFDFEPIILSQKLISYYSAQESLSMCDRPTLPCKQTPVGDDWVAIEHNGDWATINSTESGRTGYLMLPNLSQMPNDASDFASAMVAYYRGDYAQAADYFNRVASRPSSQTSTRADAAVLALIAAARNTRPNLAAFNDLSEQNPDSLYIFQATIMARLAIASNAQSDMRRNQISTIISVVDKNRHLFDKDDIWLKNIDLLASKLHEN